MTQKSPRPSQGFITILTGLYSFQDCVHLLASIRRVHPAEPIVILVDRVPAYLFPLLQVFGNITLKAAPAHENPVLASRLAKMAIYEYSPFEKTIYLDADICLLANIHELFDELDHHEILVAEDLRPSILDAVNLVRDKREVLPTLQAAGLPVDEQTLQYNAGVLVFRKSPKIAELFRAFRQNFEAVLANQDTLFLRDQGAFAASMAAVRPQIKPLNPIYNFLGKWPKLYDIDPQSAKVFHCTYPYRPQFAKDVTRSLYTRIFDRLARVFLPNQTTNEWRQKKAAPLANPGANTGASAGASAGANANSDVDVNASATNASATNA